MAFSIYDLNVIEDSPSNRKIMIPTRLLAGIEQRSKIFGKFASNETAPKQATLKFIDSEKNEEYCTMTTDLKKSDFSDEVYEASFDHTLAIDKEVWLESELYFDDIKINGNTLRVSIIKPKFLLQTDKPIYRPGETMRFFILSIDPFKNYIKAQTSEVNCKKPGLEEISRFPTLPEKFEVSVKDFKGEVLKKITDIKLKSLRIMEFTFHEDVPEGKYYIYVNYDDSDISIGSVDVKHFVLPRFKANVNIKEITEDNLIKGEVCAEYTNGERFKGSAEVSIEYFFHRPVENINKTIYLNGGCSDVEMEYIEDRKPIGFVFYKPKKTFKLLASVQEAGTEVVVVATDEMKEEITKESFFKELTIDRPLPGRFTVKAPSNKNFTEYIVIAGGSNVEGNFPLEGEETLMLPSTLKLTITAFDTVNKKNITMKASKIRTNYFYDFWNSHSDSDYRQWDVEYALSGNECTETLKVGFLRKASSNISQIKILPQQPNFSFKELEYKLSKQKCSDRDDDYGHFKCNEDGTITCKEGWTGDNCILKLCKEDMSNKPCSLSEAKKKQDIHFYYDEFEISLENFYGASFSLLAYTFNNTKYESRKIEVKNLKACSSPILKKSLIESFEFNQERVLPAQNITLIMKLKEKETITGKCLLNIFDVSLDNFRKDENPNSVSFEKFVEYLNNELIETIGYDYRFSEIMPRKVYYMNSVNERLSGLEYVPIALKEDVTDSPSSNNLSNKKRVFFPEGWIFEFIDIKNGFNKSLVAPDSLTKYAINTFCLTDSQGIFIPSQIPSFIIDKDFYVEVQPPKYLIRKEIVKVPFKYFNKFNSGNHLVTFKMSYDFNDVSIEGPTEFQTCTKSNDTMDYYINVRGKRAADTNITVEAVLSMYSSDCLQETEINPKTAVKLFNDTVVKIMRIKPEGETVEVTKTNLLCGTGMTVKMDTASLPKVVPQSFRFYTSILTNGLGVSAEKLDRLVKMPYGCGEQNLAAVYPSISVMDYLTKKNETDEKTEVMKEKAKKYIQVGYNRELTYEHNNGGYSAFGKRDAAASTWLTLHVIEVFSRGGKYLNFDISDKLSKAKAFIDNVSDVEGSCVVEKGKLFDNPDFSGLDTDIYKHLSLSLKKVRSLHYLNNYFKDIGSKKDIGEEINSVLKCIKEMIKIEKITLLPQLIIAEYAYTIGLTGTDIFDNKKEIYEELDKIVKLIIYKEDLNESPIKKKVDIVSYHLMLQAEKDIPVSEVLDEILWLISEQNILGGYYSTLATVLAVDALSRYDIKKMADKASVKVKLVPYDVSKELTLGKNDIAKDQLTSYTEGSEKDVTFEYILETADKEKCVLTKSSMMYNKYPMAYGEMFKIENNLTMHKDNCEMFSQYYCIKPGMDGMETGMLLVKQDLPTGYEIDKEQLDRIPFGKDSNPSKYEFSKYDSKIYFYFNGFQADEEDPKRCIRLKMIKTFKAYKLAESVLNVRDYYDPKITSSIEYKPDECEEKKFEESGISMVEKTFDENHLTCESEEFEEEDVKLLSNYLCKENDIISLLVDVPEKNLTKFIESSFDSHTSFNVNDFNSTLIKVCLDNENQKEESEKAKLIVVHHGYNEATKGFLTGYRNFSSREGLIKLVENMFIKSDYCQKFVKIFEKVKEYLS